MKTILISVLVLGGVVAAIALPLMDVNNGFQTLERQGYTNISRNYIPVSSWDCPWTYKTARRFTAMKDGKQVKGVVCSSSNIKIKE